MSKRHYTLEKTNLSDNYRFFTDWIARTELSDIRGMNVVLAYSTSLQYNPDNTIIIGAILLLHSRKSVYLKSRNLSNSRRFHLCHAQVVYSSQWSVNREQFLGTIKNCFLEQLFQKVTTEKQLTFDKFLNNR